MTSLIVVGGGSGGLAAAKRAAGYGAKVEKKEAAHLKNAVVADSFAEAAEWMIENSRVKG